MTNLTDTERAKVRLAFELFKATIFQVVIVETGLGRLFDRITTWLAGTWFGDLAEKFSRFSEWLDDPETPDRLSMRAKLAWRRWRMKRTQLAAREARRRLDQAIAEDERREEYIQEIAGAASSAFDEFNKNADKIVLTATDYQTNWTPVGKFRIPPEFRGEIPFVVDPREPKPPAEREPRTWLGLFPRKDKPKKGGDNETQQ